MSARIFRVLRDECGATFVEFAAVIAMFLTVVLGFVEFSYVFYQWNTATKAAQFGARLAAVSNPVPTGLRSLSGVSSTVLPGMPMPAFSYQCTGTTLNGSAGSCSGSPTSLAYDPAAMRRLLFGRNADGTVRSACVANETDRKLFGMCNVYSRLIDARNVIIRYDNTGLGYAGRPGGPVPTITVSLTGMTYNHVFLGDLLGLSNITLPSFATTVTGEDLNVAGT